jgi:hypothetical protein
MREQAFGYFFAKSTNVVWELLKANKKVYLIPQSEKNKETYEIIRQSLQALPKNIKKLSKHHIIIEIKKISNKSMFSTSKVARRQEFVWGLPDGVCRLNPKSLKKLSEHQNYQSGRTFFQKKVCLVP